MSNSLGNFVDGCWHTITFRSDIADEEVSGFASAIRKVFEREQMPKECESYRCTRPNGIQLILLSPAAARLTNELPQFSTLLKSVSVPSSKQGWKRMTIFD